MNPDEVQWSHSLLNLQPTCMSSVDTFLAYPNYLSTTFEYHILLLRSPTYAQSTLSNKPRVGWWDLHSLYLTKTWEDERAPLSPTCTIVPGIQVVPNNDTT